MNWRTSAQPASEVTGVSRAVNVSVDQAEVRELCAKLGLEISSIETLLSGGTRVVLQSGDDAAQFRRKMKSKIFEGAIQRTAWASHRGN